MNKLIIATIVAMFATAATANDRYLIAAAKMRIMMETQNVSYVWRDEDHGPVITVFGETDPNTICAMGKQTIETGVDIVHNYTTGEMIYCHDGR